MRRASDTARRAVLALMLASLVVPLTSSPPALAQPQIRDHRDPVARLQVIIKSVKVLDDRDPGFGEFEFKVRFYRFNPGCAPGTYTEACATLMLETKGDEEYFAYDGNTIVLNRGVPVEADWHEPGISPETGIPVSGGLAYGLRISGIETDSLSSDDDVGTIDRILTADNNWHIGTWTERGKQSNSDNGCWHFPLRCDFLNAEDADTVVEYEIRLTPLPDLIPTKIERFDLVGTPNDAICMEVLNSGPVAAGPFQMTLRVDDILQPLGVVEGGGLPEGQTGTLCIETTQADSARRLTVVVDEPKVVFEQNEQNNRLDRVFGPKIDADTTIHLPGNGVAPDSSSVLTPAVKAPMPTRSK